MDEQATRTHITALTPCNYHLWIWVIKVITTQANVWEYVDPECQVQAPTKPKYPRFSDFPLYLNDPISCKLTATAGFCETDDQLTRDQLTSYSLRVSAYKALLVEATEAHTGIRVVHTAVFKSALRYISVFMEDQSVRGIIQSLRDKFKRSDGEILYKLGEKYEFLISATLVTDMEAFVGQWEILREEMQAMELSKSFP